LRLAAEGLVELPRKWAKPVGVPERVAVPGTELSDAVIEDRR